MWCLDRSWARRARGSGRKRPDLLSADFNGDRERPSSPSFPLQEREVSRPPVLPSGLTPTEENDGKPRYGWLQAHLLKVRLNALMGFLHGTNQQGDILFHTVVVLLQSLETEDRGLAVGKWKGREDVGRTETTKKTSYQSSDHRDISGVHWYVIIATTPQWTANRHRFAFYSSNNDEV